MARVLCQLTEDDPVCVRRWISVSLGYRDNDTNTTIIPWETVVCHIVGRVVVIAHKMGVVEQLPDPLQEYMASLLLTVGHSPHFAAWLLRMLMQFQFLITSVLSRWQMALFICPFSTFSLT